MNENSKHQDNFEIVTTETGKQNPVAVLYSFVEFPYQSKNLEGRPKYRCA